MFLYNRHIPTLIFAAVILSQRRIDAFSVVGWHAKSHSLLIAPTLAITTTSPYKVVTATTTTTAGRSTTRLNAKTASTGNFLENVLSSFSTKQAVTIPSKPKYDAVVIDPDFRIAGLFLGLGILLDTIPYIQLTIGPFVTLLGILFLVQTFRIRFVFTDENQFELKTKSLNGNENGVDDPKAISALQDSGENVIVGGANRWDCDTIVNYDFFPKAMMDLPFFQQPILIYFKETQTPESTWNEGPGKAANNPEKIQNGSAIRGQVHFFPAICNAKQMEKEFQKRNVQKL
jgi:Protein of unknown function (DUF3119)